MKVVLLCYTKGGLSGGFKKYLNEIVPRISTNNKISQLVVFLHEKVLTEFEGELFQPINNKRKLIENIDNFNPDIIFCPTTESVKNWNIPFVVMLRNMEPLTDFGFNNPVVEDLVNLYKKIKTISVCKKASGVIAVSKFVEETLINDISINRNNLKVIYHGNKIPTSTVSPKLEKSIFTAGSIRPARGLEDLIHALTIIKKDYKNIKLYIAGDKSPRMKNYKNKLDILSESLDVKKHIIWLGNVSKEDMELLYSNNKIFVMTSRVEACPNIAIEAMTYGNIIISSRNKPMPEFFGNGALYYNALDYKNLAKLILNSLVYSDRKVRYIKNNNRKLLEKFSWDKCSDETVNFLYKIINNNHN